MKNAVIWDNITESENENPTEKEEDSMPSEIKIGKTQQYKKK